MVPSEGSADGYACNGTDVQGLDPTSAAAPDADVDGLESAQSLSKSASDSKLTEQSAGEGSLMFWLPRNGNQGLFEASHCSASLSSMAGSNRLAELDDTSSFSMTPADILGVATNSSGQQREVDTETLVVTPVSPCEVTTLASAGPAELNYEAEFMDFGLWPDTTETVLGRDVHSGPSLCSPFGGRSSDGVGMYAFDGMRSPWSSLGGSPHLEVSVDKMPPGHMGATWSQPEFADHSERFQAPPGYAPKGKGKAPANRKEQRPPPPQPSQTITTDPAIAFMDKQTLLALVPFNDEGEKASLGSRNHPNKCSPCIFWFRDLCGKGVECDYCHFRHPGQKNKRIRPSKNTRMQMRAQQAAEAGGSTRTMV
eukprot:TRINITY_DN26221_c0_g1_i2.p1 TRINITY_DN26221_c0_g1~~TRINITY_DN26221_c0_g1_i2.p1  ORF type:complete len:368 (+),score=46.43 TRINITY_DN26221_c0_g1_i2:22-1125(+)